MPSLPLAGLKVLDLSRLLPGPYASLVLADLGAQVDKVEEPKGGDGLRQMPPFLGQESALFYGLNRNKRSLTLDLKQAEGARAFARLVPHYDVLLESFRPGVMERLGLGDEALRALNPRLIVCSLTGFGQTGPDRLRAGHDLTYQARAGLLASPASSQAPPLPGGQVGDLGGSLFALVGILAALQERARTGLGQRVDISMMESALAFRHLFLAAKLLTEEAGPSLKAGEGELDGALPQYNLYRTQDGRTLAVGALEPKFFGLLCERLGKPELLAQSFGAPPERENVRQTLRTLFASQPLSAWVALLKDADVCVEPVLEGEEVLADAQLKARGLVVQGTDPQRGLDAVMHLLTPLHMGDPPLRPAPRLGEHSRQILSEAGFSEEELKGLV